MSGAEKLDQQLAELLHKAQKIKDPNLSLEGVLLEFQSAVALYEAIQTKISQPTLKTFQVTAEENNEMVTTPFSVDHV